MNNNKHAEENVIIFHNYSKTPLGNTFGTGKNIPYSGVFRQEGVCNYVIKKKECVVLFYFFLCINSAICKFYAVLTLQNNLLRQISLFYRLN